MVNDNIITQRKGSERMNERETRTYHITMESEQLNVLEAFFKDMVSYGKIGASRKLVVYVDGDGAVHPEIKREDKQSWHDATEQRPIYRRYPKIYGNAKADGTSSSGTHRRDNSL